MIKVVHEVCNIFKVQSSKPRCFNLKLGTETMLSNDPVYVDTMFITGRPFIHLVDKGTHFSAASLMRTQPTSDTCKSILRLWVHTYLGPPDFLQDYEGSAYISPEMKSVIEAYRIQIEETPIENPVTMVILERYHSPSSSAYRKIRDPLSKSTTHPHCLKMDV